MPNNNPSGPNQPLRHHPLPLNGRYSLGEDAVIHNNMVADTDYQMVPAPPEGVVRDASVIAGQFLVAGEGAADLVDVEARFVDRNGRETRLTLDAAVAADTLFPSGLTIWGAPFFLLSEDGGINFRWASGGGGGEANVAHSSWQDVRNVYRQITALSTQRQSVLPAPREGECLVMPNFDQVPSNLFPVMNFSDADADVLLELYDGSDNVRIQAPTTIPAAVTPGVLGSIGYAYLAPALAIPPGWELRARLLTPAPSHPVELYAFYQLTNQGPVRQDQGGAY
jgi:hypothetical protein